MQKGNEHIPNENAHWHPPSAVTGKEISMQAADWAFLNGGLPGPRRLAFETSALESRFPDPQVWDVGLVQCPFTWSVVKIKRFKEECQFLPLECRGDEKADA